MMTAAAQAGGESDRRIHRRVQISAELRLALRRIHIQARAEAIVWPDASGAFPRHGISRGARRPVVVDSDVLRRDMLRGFRQSGRTVLVNAANRGFLHVYCAEHVAEEVVDDIEEWAHEEGIDPEALLESFIRDYVPILRVVEVPDGMLSRAEAERIELLASGSGRSDVPSATLALLIAAPLLSEDVKPLRAVYGEAFNYDEHRKWLQTLQAAGDLGVFGQMGQFAGMLGSLAADAASRGVRKTRTLVPTPALVIVVLVGAALVIYALRKPERRQAVKNVARTVVDVAGPLVEQYADQLASYERARPKVPDWEDLWPDLDRRALLARACMFTLARSADPFLSAERLSTNLPELPVGQGEQLSREMLRSLECFDKPYIGSWQLGYSLANYFVTDDPDQAGPTPKAAP